MTKLNKANVLIKAIKDGFDEEVKEVISEIEVSDISKNLLAKHIGVSDATFWRKINNMSFTELEIRNLKMKIGSSSKAFKVKKKKYSIQKVIAIVQMIDSGTPKKTIMKKKGIPLSTLYVWQRKFSKPKPMEEMTSMEMMVRLHSYLNYPETRKKSSSN